MTFTRTTAFPAAALLGFAAILVTVAATPAAAADGAAKYCIARSTSAGEYSNTGFCIFNDYEKCLQAAIGSGNCVPNIDYRGDTTPTSTGRSRRAR